jgi:hypothetical protein
MNDERFEEIKDRVEEGFYSGAALEDVKTCISQIIRYKEVLADIEESLQRLARGFGMAEDTEPALVVEQVWGRILQFPLHLSASDC